MSEHDDSSAEWSRPRPEHTPSPTYWPMVLAAGIVLAAFGLIVSPWFVALGVVLVAIAVAEWMGELRHECD